MDTRRVIIRYTPEILLLIAGITCLAGEWMATSSINGLVVLGIAVIASLLVWKNKYLALGIAIFLGMASVFFILAALAEFSEFPHSNSERWVLLSGGTLVFGSLFAISLIMPRKYFNQVTTR